MYEVYNVWTCKAIAVYRWQWPARPARLGAWYYGANHDYGVRGLSDWMAVRIIITERLDSELARAFYHGSNT